MSYLSEDMSFYKLFSGAQGSRWFSYRFLISSVLQNT